jgi:crotonobetainyl-CoA:carnitine CoA-transferase CaiB-like acyl-CoA transferase
MGACSLALADLNCSFHGVFLVLAALHGRRSTGLGQHIDLSQTEACASLIGEAFVEQQLGLGTPGPRGNVGQDGEEWALIPAGEDDHWVAAGTDRQRTGADELAAIEKEQGRPSRADLLATLSRHGFEASPVLTPVEVASDELYRRQGFLQQVQHPLDMIGRLTVTSLPWHLDGSVPEVSSAAPCLGQDNDSFYSRHLTPGEYQELQEKGVFH